MPLEVRYIMFTPEEVRRAIVAFVLKEGRADTPDDILAMTVNSELKDKISVTLQLRRGVANKAVTIASDHLVGAILLYCRSRNIPVPSRAQKKIERSGDGLTLVLMTDPTHKGPVVAADHVAYTGIANYAQESSEARQELARAMARLEAAKAMVTLADARAHSAEREAAESAARLSMIERAGGLRGRLGRWLLGVTISGPAAAAGSRHGSA